MKLFQVLLPKLFILSLASLSLVIAFAEEDVSQTCSWTSTERDPALKEMVYDVGDGPQTFMAYVEPPVESFYRNSDAPSTSRVTPKFNGLAGKFINMSNKPLDFYWESSPGGAIHLMSHYEPFSTDGTGTFPGHRFFFALEEDPNARVKEFVVENYPENLYVYDPYLVEGDPVQTEKNLKQNLNKSERMQYEKWRKTLSFNEQYRNFTGRSYLANYGDQPRNPPSHFMWRADYFGQEHWVTTRETQFDRLPPVDELEPIVKTGTNRILRDSDPRILEEYRVKDQPYLNMTLKVLSVIPRTFEISNFLSQTEVDHILQLAGGIELRESTTGDVGTDRSKPKSKGFEKTTKTRTSFNSWVPREKSPIIDSIYRRAADLTRIDEALLRHRDANEHPELATKNKICEELQLVHYGPTQEYTAHHDFGYSHIDDKWNGARFATLLFYLNSDMKGGHTSFPRYVNGHTFHELAVKPEAGKAVLFYDQLPDGNMDDFSQHAAKVS